MNTAEEILQYLPLLLQLLNIIQQADTKFATNGSAAAKAVWIAQQILTALNTAGLLSNIVKGNPAKSQAIMADIVQLLTDIGA